MSNDPYVYDPQGNPILLSEYQRLYGTQSNLGIADDPPQIETIPETSQIKVFRKTPRAYAGFYRSFPAIKVNEVEQDIQSEFGGGLFEFQIWNMGQKLRHWSTKLLGEQLDQAHEPIPIDEVESEQSIDDKPMWSRGSPAAPGRPGVNNLHTKPDGSMMYESFGMSGDDWWRTTYAEAQAKIAKLERQLIEERELSRRDREALLESKSKIARLEERNEQQKYFQELSLELNKAKQGGDKDIMALILPKLLDQSLTKGKPETLADQLANLQKLKDLTGGDGGSGNSDGIEFVKALGGMVAQVAPTIWQPGQSAPAQAGAAPAGVEPYATEGFKAVLQTGLEETPDDYQAWAKNAAPHLTQAGAVALLKIPSDPAGMGRGIATWAQHLPGVDVTKLVEILKTDPSLMGWAMNAVLALKDVISA